MNEPKQTSDALALLIADHRAVDKLFDAYRGAGEATEDARFTIAKRACEQLAVHTMLEEELLYPAASEVLPTEALDVDDARVEHYLVKTLIQRFTTLTPAHAGFDATFRVLADLVRRHVEEEEKELFPLLRRSNLDLDALGRRIASRKAELDAKLEAAGVKSTGDKTLVLSHLDMPL
ncbi:hemerythrin domain-containing protein [Paraburkholderia sp. BR10872]|uniref:hemerythrin domain-containing protein n=1 Tax=Paraburkholderia sp. BR10872 TaxID=3236989 RepID=UPI0034D1AC97